MPRFSLRAFLGLMALLAAFAGWQGRRYAHYRDRAAGVIALKEYGVSLNARANLPENIRIRCVDPPPENFFARWDAYWFGSEANQTYPCCWVHLDQWLKTAAKQQPGKFTELLSRFPEIQLVYINPNDHYQQTEKYDQLLPELGEFWQAVGSLPSVRRMSAFVLDDRWTEALPETTKLIELITWKNHLTASGALRCLQRSPELAVLQLPLHCVNEPVAAELNRRECWRGTPLHGRMDRYSDKPWPAVLHLLCYPQGNKTQQKLPPIDHDALRQLDVDYDLYLGDASSTLDYEFAGCQARFVECTSCRSLKLEHFPRLQEASLSGHERAEVQHCARLNKLNVRNFRRVSITRLATLQDLQLEHTDEDDIRECPLLRSLIATDYGHSDHQRKSYLFLRPRQLRLEALPALRDLNVDGLGISTDDPRTIELLRTSLPPERWEELASLRGLRKIFLDNIGRGPEMSVLQQFPELTQLSFGYPYGSPDSQDPSTEIPDLRELQTLKILSVSFPYTVSKSFTKQNEHGILVSLLPAELDVLILGRDRFLHGTVPREDFARLKSLHPNLTVIDPAELDPKTNKPRVTWPMLGEQRELWQVERLRGFAAQWWLDLKPDPTPAVKESE